MVKQPWLNRGFFTMVQPYSQPWLLVNHGFTMVNHMVNHVNHGWTIPKNHGYNHGTFW